MFKSTDGGGSWGATGLISTSVEALAIDPVVPTTLYAGTNGGVFKSTNSGESWSAVNTGLANTVIDALAIDQATTATLYAGTYGGVFKSTNSGESWNAVNAGLTSTGVRSLAIDPVTPATLYAGTYDDGVFKSTNSGESWSEVNAGLTSTNVHSLAIDPVTPATLYAGTYDGGVFVIQQTVQVTSIDPIVVPSDRPTELTISGSNFVPTPTLSLGDSITLSVSYISLTTLSATLPAGLNSGWYTVTVTNPDLGQSTLVNALRVDGFPPVGGMTINGGALSTTEITVTLGLSATDATDDASALSMRFSNDGASWDNWRSYTPSASWTLTDGGGPKGVYAKFKDPAGNESSVVSSTITFNTLESPYKAFLPVLLRGYSGGW